MIVRVACAALHGVDAFRVDLEVDLARQGMPAFVMVVDLTPMDGQSSCLRWHVWRDMVAMQYDD